MAAGLPDPNVDNPIKHTGPSPPDFLTQVFSVLAAASAPHYQPVQPGAPAAFARRQGFDSPDGTTFPQQRAAGAVLEDPHQAGRKLNVDFVAQLAPGPQRRAPVPTWAPTWGWVRPPQLGAATQQVWQTYWLVPGSLIGPGDNPLSARRSLQPMPLAQGYRATLFGRPIDGGSYLYRALSNYTPVMPPAGLQQLGL